MIQDTTTSVRLSTKSVNKLKAFIKKNKQYTIGGYASQALDEKLQRDKAKNEVIDFSELKFKK